jgi:predicted DNA-binding transcriptional regulator AlpA
MQDTFSILTISDVMRLTGLTHAGILYQINHGRLPRNVLGGRNYIFSPTAVREFIENRQRFGWAKRGPKGT